MRRRAWQYKQKKQKDVFFLMMQHTPLDQQRCFPALQSSCHVFKQKGNFCFWRAFFLQEKKKKSKCQPRDKESAETIWWSESVQYALPWEQTLPWLKEQCVITVTPSSCGRYSKMLLGQVLTVCILHTPILQQNLYVPQHSVEICLILF